MSVNIKVKGIHFIFNYIMENVRHQGDNDIHGSVLYGTSSHSTDTPGWDGTAKLFTHSSASWYTRKSVWSVRESRWIPQDTSSVWRILWVLEGCYGDRISVGDQVGCGLVAVVSNPPNLCPESSP